MRHAGLYANELLFVVDFRDKPVLVTFDVEDREWLDEIRVWVALSDILRGTLSSKIALILRGNRTYVAYPGAGDAAEPR